MRTAGRADGWRHRLGESKGQRNWGSEAYVRTVGKCHGRYVLLALDSKRLEVPRGVQERVYWKTIGDGFG